MNRRHLLAALAAVPALGTARAAGLIAPPAPLPAPVKLTVGVAKVAHLAPFLDLPAVLAPMNVEVSYAEFVRYADSRTAMGSGSLDLAAMAAGDLPLLLSQGVTSVVGLMGVASSAKHPIVRNGVKCETWQDLMQLRLGVPPGSAVWYQFVAKVVELGYKYDQFKPVNIQGAGSNFAQALQRGDVDAYINAEPTESMPEVGGFGHPATAIDYSQSKAVGAELGPADGQQARFGRQGGSREAVRLGLPAERAGDGGGPGGLCVGDPEMVRAGCGHLGADRQAYQAGRGGGCRATGAAGQFPVHHRHHPEGRQRQRGAVFRPGARPLRDGKRVSQAVTAAAAAPGRSWRAPRLAGLQTLILPVCILVLWEACGRAGWIPPGILPPPTRVAVSWWDWAFGHDAFGLNNYSGTWLSSVMFSAQRVGQGYLLAILAGVPLGILIGWSPLAARLVDPTIQAMRPVPITAWLPFCIAIFGIRAFGAIFLIALGAFYPIVINSAQGARDVGRNLVRAAAMMGASPLQLLFRVVLPAALPSVFTGLRVGLGIAWTAVIVAEMVAVKSGLGYVLWDAYYIGRMDVVIADMVSIGLVGFLSDRIILAIEHRLLRWHRLSRA